MAKFPAPPSLDDVIAQDIRPQWKQLPKDTRTLCIHRLEGQYPSQWGEFRYYGPSSSRFDHHLEADTGKGYCMEPPGKWDSKPAWRNFFR